MTFATHRVEETVVARAPLAKTFNQAPPRVVPGPFGRAAVVIGDLFAAVGIVLSFPLVILGIGIPIALGVRLLLGIAGLL